MKRSTTTSAPTTERNLEILKGRDGRDGLTGPRGVIRLPGQKGANSHNTDVPCAVCYVPTRNALYMIPAKCTCPSGWTREYFGYLMSERNNHHQSQFSCVDHSLTPVIGSSQDHYGFLFYTVEGVCGPLPCPPYSRDKELSCAVCTK